MTEAERILNDALRMIAFFMNLGLSHHDAKKAALFCVNEIIKGNPITFLSDNGIFRREEEYWQKVKEKLSK